MDLSDVQATRDENGRHAEANGVGAVLQSAHAHAGDGAIALRGAFSWGAECSCASIRAQAMSGPIVTMTPFQYWARWAIVGAVFLVIARWFLVQPIVEACR